MSVTLNKNPQNISGMFNEIAASYDFLNHLLSFGIDKLWRKKLVKKVSQMPNDRILDLATGTGDLAIALAKKTKSQITGIDISEEMLKVGEVKAKKMNLDSRIEFKTGDALDLNAFYNQYNIATVAFGVRNFFETQKGLDEIYKTLVPGGHILILEFGKPANSLLKPLYQFYFANILPFIGRIFSGSRTAYKYLFQSTFDFPADQKFTSMLEKSGFTDCTYKILPLGVCRLYIGLKPNNN